VIGSIGAGSPPFLRFTLICCLSCPVLSRPVSTHAAACLIFIHVSFILYIIYSIIHSPFSPLHRYSPPNSCLRHAKTPSYIRLRGLGSFRLTRVNSTTLHRQPQLPQQHLAMCSTLTTRNIESLIEYWSSCIAQPLLFSLFSERKKKLLALLSPYSSGERLCRSFARCGGADVALVWSSPR